MTNKMGYYNGKHYTGYIDQIKLMKSNKEHSEAIQLLTKLIETIELESIKTGVGVAPWYYEQLSIIYKKEKDFENEIQVLKRYKNQKHAPGAKPKKLLEKLDKLVSK